MEALKVYTNNCFNTNYWDKTWEGRITDTSHVKMNSEKLIFLIRQLYERPEYTLKEKLDIGCGTGLHAIRMRQLNPTWAERWTGIDLSPKAVVWGKNLNLNIVHGNIFSYQFDKSFDVFLLLDSLEHIQDHKKLAARLKEIGNKDFSIFGNVPLYKSEHAEHFERDVDINVVTNFLSDCGFKGFWHEIYGIRGYPYMLFEAVR